MNNGNAQGGFLTPRNIIRVLSIISIIFFFCPMLLVSCSSSWSSDSPTIEVRPMDVVQGITYMGEEVVGPKPIYLFGLLIPIFIFFILFVKNALDTTICTAIISTSIIDLLVWFGFWSQANRIVEENSASVKTTTVFMLNIVVLVCIMLISFVVETKYYRLDQNLLYHEIGNSPGDSTIKSSNTDIIGYCAKCGSQIIYGKDACSQCGTLVPESMIKEAEEKKAEEERLRNTLELSCKNCGKVIQAGSKFCMYCGTKVPENPSMSHSINIVKKNNSRIQLVNKERKEYKYRPGIFDKVDNWRLIVSVIVMIAVLAMIIYRMVAFGDTNTDNAKEVNYTMNVIEEMESPDYGNNGYDSLSDKKIWDLEGEWYPVSGYYLDAYLKIKELSDDEIWLTAYFAPTAEVVFDGLVKLYPDYQRGVTVETARPTTRSEYDRAMSIVFMPEEDHIFINNGMITGRYERD